MATYFMFGKYSPGSTRNISGERTQQAVAQLRACNGELNSMYALLGDYDLVLIVDFPDVSDAIKASVEVGRLTGISFVTAPAIEASEFDQIMS